MNTSKVGICFNFIKKQGLVLALVILIAIIALISPRFFSANNFLLILSQVSIMGIIACAMTFVLIAGNFDLSVGSLVSMSAMVCVGLHDKIGPLAAIIITLIIGLIFGAINGFFVGYLKLNSLIVTLGVMGIINGATLLYTGGGVSLIDSPNTTWYRFLGRGTLLGVPPPLVFLLISIIVFQILLKTTVFGKHVMAVGGSSIVSRFTGIKDKKIVFITFLLSSFMSVFAGIVLGSRIMNIQPGLGAGYEFVVITGVVLGGTSLLGGEGSVIKSFLGILILGVLANGFIMMGLPYYTQWVVEWFVIIFVVYLDIRSKRKEAIA